MTLSFQPIHLLYAGIALHLLYATVTHFHKLCQIKAYLREENAKIDEYNQGRSVEYHIARWQLDPPYILMPALLTLLIGLEAKIVEVTVYTLFWVGGLVLLGTSAKPWNLRWHNPPHRDHLKVIK